MVSGLGQDGPFVNYTRKFFNLEFMVIDGNMIGQRRSGSQFTQTPCSCTL